MKCVFKGENVFLLQSWAINGPFQVWPKKRPNFKKMFDDITYT